MKNKSLFFIFLILGVFGFSQMTVALTPDITVALDGSGDYTKIQDAIDAAPSNESRRTIILVKAGLYDTEKLIVPANKTNITLLGESRDQTIISYHIYDCSTGKCPTEDAEKWTGDNIRTSATLSIHGDGFRAENLTIQNTAGPVGQAQAVTIRGDKVVFINCDLKGYQDTIYLWTDGKRSYFENCMILGRTDYIYGGGTAFFQACEIRSWGGGWITAPATSQSAPYGYVFNACDLTYVTGSPRNGDDGTTFRLGRPWHNYPKVSWLRCNITDMLNPQGWGDTWNMSYAPTSPDLHLYEYQNTGLGADMSGRADWVGLRAMTDEEALSYTVQDVLGGTDGWDPSAEAPLVTTYTWTGAGANAGWRTPENWDPNGIPGNGEIANADGVSTVIDADGDVFLADLNLSNGSTLHITQSSTANYIAGNGGRFTASSEVSLGGQLGTKESNTFDIEGVLTLNATITGVHSLIKTGQGSLILAANNTDYSGTVEVQAGTLQASVENALGNGNVTLESGATLVVGHDNAFFPQSVLKVATGAALSLSATVTLSEFYMDNVMQPIGTYDATTHPELISGMGSIVIGRPASFLFLGGNWDVASNYTPSLMPEAGETVFCEGEMETTSTIYPADVIFVNGKGRLRMRGAHQSTGSLTFEGGNRLSYATSGTGFSLEAPIIAAGDFNFEMSSSQNSSLTLTGTIVGSATISVRNTRSAEATIARAILSGDNSDFNGLWDLTTAATNSYGSVVIVGASAQAFGGGIISVGGNNRVVFSHDECTSASNEVVLANGAQATLDANVIVGKLTLGETVYTSGTFSSQSHSEFFQGNGELKVGSTTSLRDPRLNEDLKFFNNTITTRQAQLGAVQIYALNGHLVMDQTIEGNVLEIQFPLGVYVVKSSTSGLLKISVTQ